MKKLFFAFLLAAAPLMGFASGGGVHLDDADIDLSDEASLQRGAKYFVNYCLSCHSAKFQRYNRMARDLGLTEEEVKQNLMFTTDKIGNTMTIAMPQEQAEAWFGTAPPDLSVIARARGVDWLYTYFRSFYVDESRPFGVNNIVFPDVGMPHVLWELQGPQKAVFRTEQDAAGNETHVFDKFEQIAPGKLSPGEYDDVARDLTAFLSYVGEPIQMKRKSMGIWVLLFIAAFFGLAYMLKKEYWKDVH
ncbi:cytochrome c1 [Candidatus Endoriftia persephone]|jgi:ubiquinol-cytochrome c reductase cytochrome c1 subunit|uniref:Cytochrome c1 n=3 Tax=Gammaproteobacteria TaxID=1236 RepID=G2FDU5_9GAMM|nr:cytochrome c1 [Candidatus Endoriftia persephone]EGV51196.1 cytochrome c1 [endosymbiont of Riftia pachyptila (vent Ph05)]EGW54929.1 cytochrome c1 [endosymbiont of Tevnia jerichonana (vent Tica)]USF87915.1 cytochrome c1 [Candidatus Endoriftia persephone]